MRKEFFNVALFITCKYNALSKYTKIRQGQDKDGQGRDAAQDKKPVGHNYKTDAITGQDLDFSNYGKDF